MPFQCDRPLTNLDAMRKARSNKIKRCVGQPNYKTNHSKNKNIANQYNYTQPVKSL